MEIHGTEVPSILGTGTGWGLAGQGKVGIGI